VRDQLRKVTHLYDKKAFYAVSSLSEKALHGLPDRERIRAVMELARQVLVPSCHTLLRLDYLSCALTILSTVLIGKRLWHGWLVAGVNSVIICVIGIRTAQFGFVPANLFCLALYAYNLSSWRRT